MSKPEGPKPRVTETPRGLTELPPNLALQLLAQDAGIDFGKAARSLADENNEQTTHSTSPQST